MTVFITFPANDYLFSRSQFEAHHEKNQQNDLCAQRKLGSAWASAQSDQSLPCVLSGKLPRTKVLFMRTAQTLIRLGGCPGWWKSLLGAYVILLVLSCCHSFMDTRLIFMFDFHLIFMFNCHYRTLWIISKWPQVKSWQFCIKIELRHDKTNKVTVHPAKTQISLGIHPVCPHEESLSP